VPPIAELQPWLTNGPAIGLVFWLLFQLFQGKIVTRKVHEDALEQVRKQAEVWEKVANNYKASLDARDGVVPAQLESARLVEAMAKAIQELPAASGEETKA
jgi:hypothetical protein